MEPSEQTRRKEQEDFRKMLGEMRETFKQSAAELLTEEIVKPAPGEAIALLGKTFGALLDAVAESKRLWHELDARAGGAAERVRQSQMREVLARIRDGEDVDEQAESSRVALAAFEAGHEVIRDGAPAISERFAQRYRPDEMLRVSQRNYTAAYDRDGFSGLYAEMHSRYQTIVFTPKPARPERSQFRFVEEEDIRASIVRHLDLAGAFFMIFQHACLKAAQAFKFRALLEGDFFGKSCSVSDVAYILGISFTRECPFCQARTSKSEKRGRNREMTVVPERITREAISF